MFAESVSLNTDNVIGPGRVALVVEYDGRQFHGWQYQKSGVRSVEGELASAISKVANHNVELTCAGRTDAGVHASFQVIHFDAASARNIRSWVLGINTALPDDIAVHWAGQVDDEFHARFSALYRRYRYVIYNHPTRPAGLRGQVTWIHRPLDAERMHLAAQKLVGEHDFSAFRAAGCQSRTPIRFVESLRVSRRGKFVVIDVQANAFLHHMVRNFAGSLLVVGKGEEDDSWLQNVLQSRDRKLAGVTAPADGLYLVDIGYSRKCGIPQVLCGPAFVEGWFSKEENQPIQPSHIHQNAWRARECELE